MPRLSKAQRARIREIQRDFHVRAFGEELAHVNLDMIIEERHQQCLELVDRIALEKRLKLVGTTQDVLIEEGSVGRTHTNYKVYVRREAQARQGAASRNVVPGEQVRVLITNAQRATLEGEIHNGNVTFENFWEEDSRVRTCSD